MAGVIAIFAVGLVVGAAVCAVALRLWAGSRVNAAGRRKDELLGEAAREAENVRREAQIEASEKAIQLRAQLEEEVRDRRAQILRVEERVLAREAEVE